MTALSPYGSWKSPITTDLIVGNSISVSQPAFDGDDLYWVERRPTEEGRSTLVKRAKDGTITDLLPRSFNARTRVHEYGGGDFAVSDGILYFSNFKDQRLYRLVPGEEPQPITPEANMRYADGMVDQRRNRLLCVREDHTESDIQAVNSIVSVPLDGHGSVEVLVSGNDFYAYPRLSPDGSRLAWLTWNHPNMPWDGTELWVADLNETGAPVNARQVAGGKTESIFQPQWSPSGQLYYVSDRTGWWNIYRLGSEQAGPVYKRDVEFGEPLWLLGFAMYGFRSDNELICIYQENGEGHLVRLNSGNGEAQPLELPYTNYNMMVVSGERAAFIASSPTEFTSLIELNLATNQLEVVRRNSNLTLDKASLSVPEAIEFPTEHGLTAYAFYYAPRNANQQAPEGELPPLLVISHGGPTSSTTNALVLSTQYWTSRGFAVLDVNYGGSTGYGRTYRQRLNGQFGIVDTYDCINGAKYLVEKGLVDPKRLAIRGGSAGGYTTLCALAFHKTFNAGGCHFGVSDPAALARDTHKFESRYMDSMVGPYPEMEDVYKERTPILYADQISCPVIFFQGLDDHVVTPDQSELMVNVLRENKLPVAYIAYEGEGHGFRMAKNIKRTFEAESYFFARVFGFELADQVEPVEIYNM